MECQNTTKNLKINRNKSIGTIVVVVEGEDDEFRLLKHIFTNVLDYNYISIKRNKIIQHEFISKSNKNTVVVANTRSSSIKTIIDDEDYKDKLYNLLKKEYNKSLKNTNVYIIWDRDKDSNDDEKVQGYYKKAIDTFSSSLDNDYEMNGLLLLSYPCMKVIIYQILRKNFVIKNFILVKIVKKNLMNLDFQLKILMRKLCC